MSGGIRHDLGSTILSNFVLRVKRPYHVRAPCTLYHALRYVSEIPVLYRIMYLSSLSTLFCKGQPRQCSTYQTQDLFVFPHSHRDLLHFYQIQHDLSKHSDCPNIISRFLLIYLLHMKCFRPLQAVLALADK